MQHRRCVVQVAILCFAVLVSSADAQHCKGCLDAGCLDCGPLASGHAGGLFAARFCERPPACFGSASFDLMLLERNNADFQDVLFVGAVPVANAQDLNFHGEAGFRFDLLLHGDRGCDFNFNIMSAGPDNALVTRDDPGVSFVFFGSGPAAPAASYTLQYESDLISVETNLRSRQWARFAPLVGFRVLYLEEDFNIWETGTTTGFFSGTENQMYGLQIGGQALLFERPRWRIETIAKAGVFYNQVDMSASALNVQLDGDFSRASFVGEIQFMLVHQLGPRMLLRAGYQGLWLSSVAKAPDQSDDGVFVTGLLALDPGDVIYQGGFVGFEITW